MNKPDIDLSCQAFMLSETSMSLKRKAHRGSSWSVGAMCNPRPPAVPATLDITLDEYYAAAGAIGLLSAQMQEPDPEWVSQWSLDFGERMAADARRRRLKPVKK